jgi:hypothetical protein
MKFMLLMLFWICVLGFLGFVLVTIIVGDNREANRQDISSHALISQLNQTDLVSSKSIVGVDGNITYYVITSRNQFIEVNQSVWNQLDWVVAK